MAPEQQKSPKCPACGYPVEISEHSPTCKIAGGESLVETEQMAEEADSKERGTAEVLATLSPEYIEDREGIGRDMYTFATTNGESVKVLFYSRDELPNSREMVQGRQGFVIGDQPKIRTKEEWSGFLQGIRDGSEKDISPTASMGQEISEARTAGKASFFVESSPQGLLDLAFQLGVEDKQLREMRRKLSRREITPEIEEMVDKVIAAKVIGDDGNFRSERNTDGEALMLLALQGNEEAHKLLNKRIEQLKGKDVEREEKMAEFIDRQYESAEKAKPELEPLEIDSLVAVHATGYRPWRTKEGLAIKSTFDGTDWEDPRNTIHFALNHHVAGHMYGTWDRSPYVVLSPLRDMINHNKKPDVLNTVDTYFETSPGNDLVLPKENAWIIEPDELPNGVLYESRPEGRVVYKKGRYTRGDMKQLWERLHPVDRGHLDNDILESFRSALYYDMRKEEGDDDFIDRQERIVQKIKKVLASQYPEDENDREPAEVFHALTRKGLEEIIESAIQKAGLGEVIDGEVRRKIAQRIEEKIRSAIKDLTVNATIKDMGYEVQNGGMWAWGDSWNVSYQTMKLGKKLGLPVGAHSGFQSSIISEQYRGGWSSGNGLLNDLRDGRVTIKQYRADTERINREYLPEMSPETRRMLYLRGLI